MQVDAGQKTTIHSKTETRQHLDASIEPEDNKKIHEMLIYQ